MFYLRNYIWQRMNKTKQNEQKHFLVSGYPDYIVTNRIWLNEGSFRGNKDRSFRFVFFRNSFFTMLRQYS